MALDPRISLAATPVDFYAAQQRGTQDALSNQAKTMENQAAAQKLQYLPQQLEQQTALDDAKVQSAKLDVASKQNDEEYKLLSSANAGNYGQIRQLAVAKYGPQADQTLPPVYDKTALDNMAASRLDIKDKLTLQQQKLEMDLKRDTFAEDKRHNLADEAINMKKADSPFGTSFQGKAYNTLLNGDPNSPAYALAVNAATQPKLQPIQNADGTTSLVAVTPQLPDSIRKPGAMAAPDPRSTPTHIIQPPVDIAKVGSQQGVLTPPVVNGAADATPTTQGPLLGAPAVAGGRSYSVEPIAGATGAAKLTDDQTKAAGFAERTINSHNIINQLSNAGYSPSLVTDNLGDSKVGNAALTPQGQQFIQAKRDFVNAVLRRESGAAIGQSEFDNANKQYFPQPGDSKEVIAQKAKNRESAIQSLKLSAGGAMKRMSDMNASAPQAIPSLPAGATQIGTSGGKPVYATPDGKHFVAQ